MRFSISFIMILWQSLLVVYSQRYISVGYGSGTGSRLYTTENFETCKILCPLDEMKKQMWDSSIMYYKGYYYIISDYLDRDYNSFDKLDNNYFLGGNKIGIHKTKDFKTFEFWDIELPLKYKQTWAPEFFIDNKKVYIAVALSDGSLFKRSNEKEGYKKEIYLVRLTKDLKRTKRIDKLKLEMPDNGNHSFIDPIIFTDKKKYLYVKDDYDNTIVIFSSRGKYNFKYENKLVGYSLEAPFVVKVGNSYKMLTFEHSKRTNLVFNSDDLTNWNQPHSLIIDDKSFIYHTTFIKYDEKN